MEMHTKSEKTTT